MVTYKAWIDTDILASWNSRREAYRGIQSWIEANPDDSGVVYFGAFKSTDNGLQPLFSLQGESAIMEHISDVEAD